MDRGKDFIILSGPLKSFSDKAKEIMSKGGETRKVAALFSGGKDSTMALYMAMQRGWQAKYLVSMLSENPESYMFHHPNIHLTGLQSQSMGIPIIKWKTKGEKEKELDDLKAALESIKNEIDTVSAGALASQYQYDRVKRICLELGMEAYAPLWHIDPEEHWKGIFEAGFVVMVTAVGCDGLGPEWLGRIIDRDSFRLLKLLSRKHQFHLGFEGGEAETLVMDGPIFSKRLHVVKAEKVWDNKTGSGYLDIKEASLA